MSRLRLARWPNVNSIQSILCNLEGSRLRSWRVIGLDCLLCWCLERESPVSPLTIVGVFVRICVSTLADRKVDAVYWLSSRPTSFALPVLTPGEIWQSWVSRRKWRTKFYAQLYLCASTRLLARDVYVQYSINRVLETNAAMLVPLDSSIVRVPIELKPSEEFNWITKL